MTRAFFILALLNFSQWMLMESCCRYGRANITILYKAVFNRVKLKKARSKGFVYFLPC